MRPVLCQLRPALHASGIKIPHIELDAARGDGLAQLAHQGLKVVQIVYGVEARAEDLVALIEVALFGTTVVTAGVAATVFIERTRVVALARVADAALARAQGQMAVARVARGPHAIEHVDAASHGLDDVLG